MRSFMLDKLVRDKIYDEMLERGQNPHTKKLDDAQYLKELKKKIIEEASELDFKKENLIKELGDLLEAVESMGRAAGIGFDEIRSKQKEVNAKWGAFDKRRYVGRLDLNDDDPWADYYAAEPARFKEVND